MWINIEGLSEGIFLRNANPGAWISIREHAAPERTRIVHIPVPKRIQIPDMMMEGVIVVERCGSGPGCGRCVAVPLAEGGVEDMDLAAGPQQQQSGFYNPP
jgi:hypothetical protein